MSTLVGFGSLWLTAIDFGWLRWLPLTLMSMIDFYYLSWFSLTKGRPLFNVVDFGYLWLTWESVVEFDYHWLHLLTWLALVDLANSGWLCLTMANFCWVVDCDWLWLTWLIVVDCGWHGRYSTYNSYRLYLIKIGNVTLQFTQ